MNHKGVRGNPEAERVGMEPPLQMHQLKAKHMCHLARICQLFHMIQKARMDKQNAGRAKREAGILIVKFELQGSYLAKAEKMAEIKVKQEEDRHAARLHSFSGDSVISKGSKASAEKTDMEKSLKYIGAPWKNKASKPEEHRPIVYPESQEFLVLGSQLLTDLKDNIYCLTNKLMEVTKQHDHSGYFLIEDTFYNDMRHYSAVDYSKPIIE